MREARRAPLLWACLLALAAIASPLAPQSPVQEGSRQRGIRPPELLISSHQLANQLRVLMLEDHSVPVINLQVWYHVGSKDERVGRTGFAHLFEHLMFKGSAQVGPDEHSRIIEAMGGFDNAYTTDDVTVYFETFPSNYLERVLWLEADRMDSLNVDAANFRSEREVVKEERRTRVENAPYGRVVEDLYLAAFTLHPYKHTTMGSMEDLNKARIEDVREFFRTFYRPNNATLVIVGDFQPAQVVGWAEKYFGGIPQSAKPVPRVTVQEPPQLHEQSLAKSYSNTPLPAVIAGYRMPARYAPDSYPLDLASNILSQGESSRLYRKLVYEDRIALRAEGGGNFTEQPNLFWLLAVMNQGHTAAEGVKAIEAVLEQMKVAPVEARELHKAKNQVIAGFILGRRTMQRKAEAIGEAGVLGRDPDLVNTELDRYLSVTAKDIQRVAQKYFVNRQRTLLVVEPQKSLEKH